MPQLARRAPNHGWRRTSVAGLSTRRHAVHLDLTVTDSGGRLPKPLRQPQKGDDRVEEAFALRGVRPLLDASKVTLLPAVVLFADGTKARFSA
jgi:hypothetical protein